MKMFSGSVILDPEVACDVRLQSRAVLPPVGVSLTDSFLKGRIRGEHFVSLHRSCVKPLMLLFI